MIQIHEILRQAVEQGASDIHLVVTMPPILRVHTELSVMKGPALRDTEIAEILKQLAGQEKFEKFQTQRDLDFSLVIDNLARFRVNAHFQRDTAAMSFRVIPELTPDLGALNLPPILEQLAALPRGLVLVTGHTGSGKSTTLAAMIGLINQTRSRRIITLEDPIEYSFLNEKSVIEQREIGSDCLTFAKGLRQALRQDPDIILVGEMRDLETTSATITAAETGHLVFSTLHTLNAAQTIERIIDIYPSTQQNQIRVMLANTLQAIVSQTLFPRIDAPGMVPAVEILLCNLAVRNCIRENKITDIQNVIETASKIGMQSLDKSISELFFEGRIDKQQAVLRAGDAVRMQRNLDTRQPAGSG